METNMLQGVRAVVLPARDLAASVTAWTAMLGQEPAYQTADFAAFVDSGVEIGLSRLPWVDHPLVFWKVEDIEVTHQALVAAGARALVEAPDGSLTEAPAERLTGITTVPGRRLAVLRAADGNVIGLMQETPAAWTTNQG